jgi:hypothetical protein
VATNQYLQYWMKMVTSFDRQISNKVRCKFYVFTDQPSLALEHAKTLSTSSSVMAIEVPNYGWPDATILRFDMISSVCEQAQEEVLMHMDADMVVHKPLGEDFLTASDSHGVFAVAHPVFYKSFSRQKHLDEKIRKSSLGLFTKWPFNSVEGSWETRDGISEAYVPSPLRKVYLCGAVWGGKRNKFVAMVRDLRESVARDTRSGQMATWHDESHLNKWMSEHPFQLLDPKYCWTEQWSRPDGLQCIIEAVDKGEDDPRLNMA